MKSILKLIITATTSLLLVACSNNPNNITGAGSSFIYPAISIWARDYAKVSPTRVNYQAIGSGGGLQQIYSGTIDFAASDMPLTQAQLQQHKLKQFPMIIGGIVMTINIPGIKDNTLVLNGTVLENIYRGNIKNWNDPKIEALNKGLKLPGNPIITVHRADGSGTTFNFTNYLSKISPEWKKNVGSNTIVAWPGNGIGAKSNAGVAAQITQTPYSIGYVEYAYAAQTNMAVAKLQNSAGNIVTANAKSFAAAAKNANWQASNGFYQILTNQPGAQSWPIVATTFILIPVKSRTPQVRKNALDFFKWCYKNGGKAASQLDYVAIPTNVSNKILSTF